MMRRLSLFFILVITGYAAVAQTARIQIIHNSPDTLVRFVDVYVNGALAFDSLQFRTATPFFDIAAGVDVEIKLAAAQTDDINLSFYTEVFNLTPNAAYVAVANGETYPFLYNPYMPFNIDVYENALETGTNASGTDIMVCQGSPDLATVDVAETELIQLTAFEDLAYGGFSGYLGLFTANYVLTVTDQDGVESFGSFSAPFTDYGWGGDAVTIVCSGFINQSSNNNGPAFGLWVATAAGGPLIELPVLELNLTARVQVIHNCADQLAGEVDVYLNGNMIYDDLAFRSSTAFADVPAAQQIELAIAPSGSTSADEALASYTMELISGQTYVMVANGILSADGYVPMIPFSLDILTGARETAMVPTDVMVTVFNGSTDAPTIEIQETLVWNSLLVEGIDYAGFSGYFSGPVDNYVYSVYDDTGTNLLGEFQAAFETNNMQGLAVTILTSGFLNPAANSDGPEFGLWVSLPEGGDLIPLLVVPDEPVYASAQFIHNCADAQASVIDLYLNEELIGDDIAFRSATSYLSFQVNDPVVVGIAGADSQNATDAFAQFELNLEADNDHVIMISGIASASGYNPAPELALHVYDQARQNALIPSQTDVLIYHGGTDTPELDIAELTVPLPDMADNLSYSDFTGYVSLPASGDYALQLMDAAGTVTIGQYGLPLNSFNLSGESVVVFASGFFIPENNSNGAEFSLWMAVPDGTTTELPIYVGVEEQMVMNDFRLFPNPSEGLIRITGESAGSGIVDIAVLDARQRMVWNSSSMNTGINFSRAIDISSLEPGCYFLRLSDGDHVEMHPVMISR